MEQLGITLKCLVIPWDQTVIPITPHDVVQLTADVADAPTAQEGQAATVGSRRREGLLSASCGGVAGRLVRRLVRGALKAVDAGLIR